MQNVECILSDTYSYPNYIKTEIKVSTEKLTKKEEPLNSNLAELIEVKGLTFPVSLSY